MSDEWTEVHQRFMDRLEPNDLTPRLEASNLITEGEHEVINSQMNRSHRVSKLMGILKRKLDGPEQLIQPLKQAGYRDIADTIALMSRTEENNPLIYNQPKKIDSNRRFQSGTKAKILLVSMPIAVVFFILTIIGFIIYYFAFVSASQTPPIEKVSTISALLTQQPNGPSTNALHNAQCPLGNALQPNGTGIREYITDPTDDWSKNSTIRTKSTEANRPMKFKQETKRVYYEDRYGTKFAPGKARKRTCVINPPFFDPEHSETVTVYEKEYFTFWYTKVSGYRRATKIDRCGMVTSKESITNVTATVKLIFKPYVHSGSVSFFLFMFDGPFTNSSTSIHVGTCSKHLSNSAGIPPNYRETLECSFPNLKLRKGQRLAVRLYDSSKIVLFGTEFTLSYTYASLS